MARAAAALCVLGLLGCSDGRYVIGHQTGADAVMTDGGTDAGTDAGASAGVGECADRISALACSGFEPESLTAEWSSVVTNGDGVLERSTARVHTGQGALHATSLGAMSMNVLVNRFEAVLGGELHLRAHLYVPAGQPTEIINVFYLGTPGPAPFVGIDFNLEDDAVQVFSPQADPSRQTGSVLIPRDAWFCFQARIEVRDAGGVVQVRVDGVPAIEATEIDTRPPDGIDELRVGIDWSSEQEEPFELYIDDVVVDTIEIACLAP